MTWFLEAVRQEVNNLESSAVVQELEFAINRALYGLLWSLGNQYIIGSLSWCSVAHTESFKAKWLQRPFTTDVSSSEVSLQALISPISSCFKVLIQCNRQTTTNWMLFAALSAGPKTYFLWKSWIPCLKCRKVDLGLGGKRLVFCK